MNPFKKRYMQLIWWLCAKIDGEPIPTIHEIRAEFIKQAASLSDSAREEVIRSLIMVYMPEFHLHRDPQRKKHGCDTFEQQDTI